MLDRVCNGGRTKKMMSATLGENSMFFDLVLKKRCIPQAIEFHHVDPSTKVANVSDMAYDMFSIKTILKEIAKCVALCVLCHAEETHRDSTN